MGKTRIIERGSACLEWGTENETWGIVEDIEENIASEKDELEDGDGEVVGVVYRKIHKKVTGKYIPLDTAGSDDPPEQTALTIADTLIGSNITVKHGGTTSSILVDDAKWNRKKGVRMEFAIEGTYYPNVSLS